jgi:hypothetical protein
MQERVFLFSTTKKDDISKQLLETPSVLESAPMLELLLDSFLGLSFLLRADFLFAAVSFKFLRFTFLVVVLVFLVVVV